MESAAGPPLISGHSAALRSAGTSAGTVQSCRKRGAATIAAARAAARAAHRRSRARWARDRRSLAARSRRGIIALCRPLVKRPDENLHEAVRLVPVESAVVECQRDVAARADGYFFLIALLHHHRALLELADPENGRLRLI